MVLKKKGTSGIENIDADFFFSLSLFFSLFLYVNMIGLFLLD
jgi:hypothetical protein